jgi:hypothetical protein
MDLSRFARSCLLVVVVATLTACGRGTEPIDAETQRSVDAAEATAERALETAEDVEVRVTGLETDLLEALRARRALARQVETGQKRLRASMAALRSALEELRSKTRGAGDDAAAALDAAAAAARDLSVLTRRFDYHLRSGGGR